MNLDISQITSCGSDWETNHYTFLRTIKDWRSELRKYKLFPALEYSQQFQNKFIDILDENVESKDWLEKEVRGAFINDQLVVLEKAHQISYQLEKLIDFVKWALKVNTDILDEGEIIRQFVYDDVEIAPATETNKYRGKGFILIPDNERRLYKIYLYELSISWTVDEPVEFLELDLLRSIPIDLVDKTPENLMNEFIECTQQLYDPMVYICKTNLDLPFNETILPVIKSKLLESVNGLYPYI